MSTQFGKLPTQALASVIQPQQFDSDLTEGRNDPVGYGSLLAQSSPSTGQSSLPEISSIGSNPAFEQAYLLHRNFSNIGGMNPGASKGVDQLFESIRKSQAVNNIGKAIVAGNALVSKGDFEKAEQVYLNTMQYSLLNAKEYLPYLIPQIQEIQKKRAVAANADQILDTYRAVLQSPNAPPQLKLAVEALRAKIAENPGLTLSPDLIIKLGDQMGVDVTYNAQAQTLVTRNKFNGDIFNETPLTSYPTIEHSKELSQAVLAAGKDPNEFINKYRNATSLQRRIEKGMPYEQAREAIKAIEGFNTEYSDVFKTAYPRGLAEKNIGASPDVRQAIESVGGTGPAVNRLISPPGQGGQRQVPSSQRLAPQSPQNPQISQQPQQVPLTDTYKITLYNPLNKTTLTIPVPKALSITNQDEFDKYVGSQNPSLKDLRFVSGEKLPEVSQVSRQESSFPQRESYPPGPQGDIQYNAAVTAQKEYMSKQAGVEAVRQTPPVDPTKHITFDARTLSPIQGVNVGETENTFAVSEKERDVFNAGKALLDKINAHKQELAVLTQRTGGREGLSGTLQDKLNQWFSGSVPEFQAFRNSIATLNNAWQEFERAKNPDNKEIGDVRRTLGSGLLSKDASLKEALDHLNYTVSKELLNKVPENVRGKTPLKTETEAYEKYREELSKKPSSDSSQPKRKWEKIQ